MQTLIQDVSRHPTLILLLVCYDVVRRTTSALPGVFLVHHYEAKQIQIVIKKCHKSTDGNHLFGGEFTNQVILSNFEQQLNKTSTYISKLELISSKIQRLMGFKIM